MIRVFADHLTFAGNEYRCAIGPGGFTANKREGDGCTPSGVFPLRECLIRDDRITIPRHCERSEATQSCTHSLQQDGLLRCARNDGRVGLPLRVITPQDGWCDDPADPLYNRPVTLPYPASHERLWREDHMYDIIIPIGYNDDPVIPGRGSAIFFHLAKPGYVPTEGCVAVALPDMLKILSEINENTVISMGIV